MKTDKTRPNPPSDRQEWIDQKLEAYLDGELAPEELYEIEHLLESDDRWHEELQLALAIRDELRALSPPPCPEPLRQAIVGRARHEFLQHLVQRFEDFLLGGWLSHWKPVLATLLVLIAATFLLTRHFPTDTMPPEPLSQAEVDQALSEVKWTLGYVSKTGRLTGDSIQDALAPILKETPDED